MLTVTLYTKSTFIYIYIYNLKLWVEQMAISFLGNYIEPLIEHIINFNFSLDKKSDVLIKRHNYCHFFERTIFGNANIKLALTECLQLFMISCFL